jgi:hypothetical protein
MTLFPWPSPIPRETKSYDFLSDIAVAKNKTLYVSEEDASIWDEAKRLLAFYRGKRRSTYLTEHLRKYVREEKARQSAKRGEDQNSVRFRLTIANVLGA